MDNEDLFRLTFNAHEFAESKALDALVTELQQQPVEVLTCLCDPQWGWERRSWLSETIIEYANEVLNEKLDALVEV